MHRTVGAETWNPLNTEGNGLLCKWILLAPVALMESYSMQNLGFPISEYLDTFTSFIFWSAWHFLDELTL